MDCFKNIKGLMAQNFLQMFENKAEVILFSPADSIKSITNSLSTQITLV